MSSSRPATVSLSLKTLAEHGDHAGPYGDGWGIGYYEDTDIRLIKAVEAAGDSDWVRFVQSHRLTSPVVIAHLRRATMGERTYRNTQPFARELAGRMHLFAHNGWLPDIFTAPRLTPSRFQPIGETDSERAFCVLLDRLAQIWTRPGVAPPIEDRLSVLATFAQELRSLGPANFLYSDGDAVFAHGHRRIQAASHRIAPPGLMLLQRQCSAGSQGIDAAGVSVAGSGQSVTLFASVPLSDEPWLPLHEGELVVAVGGQVVARIPAQAPGLDAA